VLRDEPRLNRAFAEYAQDRGFAVDPARRAELERELPPAQWNYRQIGVLRSAPGVDVTRDGTVMEFSHSGYQHFS